MIKNKQARIMKLKKEVGTNYKYTGSKPNYIHELTRVIYKFIPTFGKRMDLAS